MLPAHELSQSLICLLTLSHVLHFLIPYSCTSAGELAHLPCTFLLGCATSGCDLCGPVSGCATSPACDAGVAGSGSSSCAVTAPQPAVTPPAPAVTEPLAAVTAGGTYVDGAGVTRLAVAVLGRTMDGRSGERGMGCAVAYSDSSLMAAVQ